MGCRPLRAIGLAGCQLSRLGRPMMPDDQLRTELTAMRDYDQALRRAVASSRDPVGQGIEDPAAADARNARRLGEIITEGGWPSEAPVGREGSQAAWLIAQHARHDPGFQRRCLELILSTPGHGLEPLQIALLTDAVAVGEGQPEVYGSQGSLRVLDLTTSMHVGRKWD